MSAHGGPHAVTSKVDEELLQFLDNEAERCGISRSEVIRFILLDFYASHQGEIECPECGQELVFNPCP